MLKLAVQDFLSEEESRRQNAHRLLNETPFEMFLLKLSEMLAEPDMTEAEKNLVVVLLRKRIVTDGASIDAIACSEARTQAGTRVLSALMMETDLKAFKRLVDCVGALAGILFEDTEWPEMQQMFSSFLSGSVRIPLGHFLMLVEVFLEYPIMTRLEVDSWLGELLMRGFASSNRDDRIAALHTAVSAAENFDAQRYSRSHISVVVESVFEVALTFPLDVTCLDALLAFVMALKPDEIHCDPLLGIRGMLLSSIKAQHKHSDDPQMVLFQIFIQLHVRNPGVMSFALLENTLCSLLDMLVGAMSLEDFRDWETAGEEEGTEDAVILQDGLRKLLEAFEELDGFDELVRSVIDRYISRSETSLGKVGGFIMLKLVAEYTPQLIEESLDDLKDHVIGALMTNDDPRIRHAILTFFFTGVTTLSPTMLDVMGDQMIKSIQNVLLNDKSSKVVKKSLAALCTLVLTSDLHSMDAVVLSALPMLIDPILVSAMQSADVEIVELAIDCVSSLVTISQEKFRPYYLPFLLFARQCIHDTVLALQGEQAIPDLFEACLELFGQIVVAVSPEEIGMDIAVVSSHMIFLVNEGLCKTSRTLFKSCEVVPAIILCVGRLAEAFPNRSTEMIQGVFPGLLEAARYDVSPEVVQKASQRRHGHISFNTEAESTHVVVRGKHGVENVYTINTAMVEEKKQALRALKSIVSFCPRNVGPELMEKLFSVATACLEGPRFGVINEEALDLLGGIFAISISEAKTLHEACSQTFKVLEIFARHAERSDLCQSACVLPPLEIVLSSLKAFIAAEGPFDDGPSMLILERCGLLLGGLLNLSMQAEMEDDPETSKLYAAESFPSDSNEMVGEIFDNAWHCLNILLKTFGPLAWESFDKFYSFPYGVLMSMDEANLTGRVAALCVYASVIEHCLPRSAQLAEKFLPLALLHTRSHTSNDDVLKLQAATYGVGIVAERVPSVFARDLKGNLQSLLDVLAAPATAQPTWRAVADCVVVAVLKVYIHHEPLDEAVLVDVLSTWLPLTEDLDEGVALLRLLTGMVTSQHRLLCNAQLRAILHSVKHDTEFLELVAAQDMGKTAVEEFELCTQ
ncbi:MAG: uncharacterized protein KVP18_002202 [Porospora cf. gigantea A]|uniref:uncharacterized protein n=1 Tax=Porospora cf. gigantea A TaxID=2853593 RepID=UPI003559650B|nr:MAG: hypothetical protein KVP18_002202 [Porospora cf. gigantea A]